MTEYNDYSLANDQDYNSMKKAYTLSENLDIGDINEILNKMREQHHLLEAENSKHKYDEIIKILLGDIDEIERIVNTTIRASKVSSKNASNHKINGHLHLNSTKNKHYSTILTNNSMSSNLNTNKLNNYPQRGTLFNRISRRIYRNINSISNRFRCGCNPKFNNSQNNYSDTYLNKSPNQYNNLDRSTPSPFFASPDNSRYSIDLDSGLNIASHCDSRRKMQTNQLDILRLLLLYMALRPNNHYCPILCEISLHQHSILMSLA